MNYRRITSLALSMVLIAGVTACSEPEDTAATSTTSATGGSNRCDPDDLVGCAKTTTIADAVGDKLGKATGEPIVIGMVNQENTPGGSYPELSGAIRAGVDFVNNELGGINGRPIELKVCNTEFSAEGSTACAQTLIDNDAIAVLGGIDVFGNAIDVLADNDIAYVGGIPVSEQSATSANSFQFSGGIWGAAVAFADHALRNDAENVSIVYGDFGALASAAEMGRTVLERAGAKVQMVPYPILSTDLAPNLAVVEGAKPDAVFMLASDTGCQAGFSGLSALNLDATLYFVGSCAAPAVTKAAGNDVTEGVVFNVEGPVNRADPSPDQSLYEAIIAKYGSDGLDPISAGTVTFRAFMNLYMILVGLDAKPDAPAVLKALHAQVNTPSFAGHPYTCDKLQFSGLPAMCAPQQILTEMHDGVLTQVGDWIDVGAIERG